MSSISGTSTAPVKAIQSLLLIDDDAGCRDLESFVLEQAGYQVEIAVNGAEGLQLFDAKRHAAVISDIYVPGLSGLRVLARVKALSPSTPVIITTGCVRTGTELSLEQLGADAFVTKPFRIQVLVDTVRSLVAMDGKGHLTVSAAQDGQTTRNAQGPGVNNRVRERARRVASAPAAASVLIAGGHASDRIELARIVHKKSSLRDGPFVVMGGGRGQSSPMRMRDAPRDVPGPTRTSAALRSALHQGSGGTLYIDRIERLNADSQAQLLRFLQERTLPQDDGFKSLDTEMRIVAGTGTNLRKRMAAGRFRADLLFRLNVFELRLPTASAATSGARSEATNIEGVRSGFQKKHPSGAGSSDIN